MPFLKLRSNYHKFLNRCDRCGHRLMMHDLEESGKCQVEYNGELPTGSDKKCRCVYYRVR